jgi:hypothetical protein
MIRIAACGRLCGANPHGGSANTVTAKPYLLRDQSASQPSAAGSPDVCSTGGNSSTLSDRAAAIASSRCWCACTSSPAPCDPSRVT